MICEIYMKYLFDIRLFMNLKGVGILLVYIFFFFLSNWYIYFKDQKKNKKIIYDLVLYVIFKF